MGRDKSRLHPRVRELCAEFERRCREAGLNVLVTETFRTVQEQDALYAQGRTKPGSIITRCKGADYQSPHQWGVAFDFCRNVRGREYDDSDGFFRKCGAVGKSIGLFWGGDFRSFVDKPHLEWAEALPNNSTRTLKQKYGTPEKYMATWGTPPHPSPAAPPSPEGEGKGGKEEKTVTYEEFLAHMTRYNAELATAEPPDWAREELAEAVAMGITDGTRPMQPIPRYQAAIMAKRAAKAAEQKKA